MCCCPLRPSACACARDADTGVAKPPDTWLPVLFFRACAALADMPGETLPRSPLRSLALDEASAALCGESSWPHLRREFGVEVAAWEEESSTRPVGVEARALL